MRAIFGEKAGEVRDTSLRVPPGVEGTVISAQVFSRKGVTKDERAKRIEEEETAKLKKDQNDEIRILRETTLKKARKAFVGKEAQTRITDDSRRVVLQKGKIIAEEDLERHVAQLLGGDPHRQRRCGNGGAARRRRLQRAGRGDPRRLPREDRTAQGGDELPPGVIKMVKVYVAIKRKLQVGDKMAGRHGNKGVLSRILPEEDMPYLEDGTPVDIVLNPLGVPSRMNVGQILETHLGWAAKELGGQTLR